MLRVGLLPNRAQQSTLRDPNAMSISLQRSSNSRSSPDYCCREAVPTQLRQDHGQRGAALWRLNNVGVCAQGRRHGVLAEKQQARVGEQAA